MSKNTDKKPEKTPEEASVDEIIEEVKAEAEAETAAETDAVAAEETQAPTETETLKAELAAQNDRYLRMLAEYDNFRRRSKQERENIYADVRGDTVVKFLPIYDNLLRAATQETDPEAKKGAEAILSQFQTVLEGLGVKEIEAMGKKFDPSLHNALLHIDDEKYGEGEIVLEITKGFTMGDKVIRFSTVQVAN